jgi:dienelactone hydrolase
MREAMRHRRFAPSRAWRILRITRVRGRALVFLLVPFLPLLLTFCSTRPDFVPRYFAPTGAGEAVLIPFGDEASDVQLVGRVCRPDVPGRRPVVVINHGAPSRPEDRLEMQPASCTSEPAQWFNARGYIVVFALRRGFGGSTGPVVENSGICSNPAYLRSGLTSAQDVEAVVRYATSLPDALPTGAIVAGLSTGGWATIAYNSLPHPRVVGLINMAGGRGGHAFGEAGENCRPDLLVAAAKRFGETGISPMLWVYALNDSFFPPALAQEMAAAYNRSGGRAGLVQPAAYGADGHGLFYAPGGSRIWGPIVDSYLATLPPPPPIPSDMPSQVPPASP